MPAFRFTTRGEDSADLDVKDLIYRELLGVPQVYTSLSPLKFELHFFIAPVAHGQ